MMLAVLVAFGTIPPLSAFGIRTVAADVRVADIGNTLDDITVAHYPLNSTYQYANRLNPSQQLSGSQVVWRAEYVSLVNPGNANDGHIATSTYPGDPVTGDRIAFSLNIKLNSYQTRATSPQNTLFSYGVDNNNNLTLRPYYGDGVAAVVLRQSGTDAVAATFPAPALDMWHNYAISLDGTPDTGKLTVWVDGVKVAEVPSHGIGADEIGHGHFRLNRTIATFSNLDSHYRDVRVFRDVLDDELAFLLASEIRLFTWNDLLASAPLTDDQTVRGNLTLPRDPNIIWTSSDDSVIDPATGKVTRPDQGSSAIRVTLTMHWFDFSQSYTVIVMPVDAGDHLIAHFNFDDPASGLVGGVARANVQGEASYEDSFEGNGRAARLSRDFWLQVTRQDGNPLLAGLDEITISYDSKPEGGIGWTFFAAPNTSTQTYLSERYVGILDETDTITVERYFNQGSRPPSAWTYSRTGWKHVDVVITTSETRLYIDGELKATEASQHLLSNILSASGGILQIGKGNWGTGEYYEGLIDNYQIFDKALTLEEMIEYRVTNIPPVISPASGETYVPVTITHPAGNSYIYYTTDGTDPDLTSTPYTGPFKVEKGTIIKAAAIAPNGNRSEIVSAYVYGSEWAATALEFRLTGQETVNNVKISWPIISRADYYEVYRGERLIGRTTGDVIDEYGLELDQEYVYTVKAVKDGAVIAQAETNAVRTFAYDTAAVVKKKNNYTGEMIDTNPEPFGVQVGDTWYHYVYRGVRDASGVVTTSIYELISTDGIHYGNERLLGSFTDMRVEMEGYTWHPLTGKVVFHAHEEASSGYGRAYLFLASVTPGGDDFQATFRGRPFDIDSRDMTFFVDDDLTAYVFFAGRVNADLIVVRLDANWEVPIEHVNTLFAGEKKESPAIMKHDGRYYFYGSTANGWYPSQAEYASAESIDGAWSPLRPILNGSTFATQGNGIWMYAGTGGRELFLANGYHWGAQYVDGFKDPMGTYSRLFPVVLHRGVATGDWFHQLDFDPVHGVIPVQAGQYLSLGKRAVDSHGLDAAAVTDGADLASSPRVQHSSLPYSIVIDLEQPARISEINLTTRIVLGSDTVYRYTLEGSTDNTTWTALADGSQNNVSGFITHRITDSGHYRYVRLTVHQIINVHTNQNATWADGIIELAVFGTPSTDKSALQAIYDEKKDTVRGTYTNASWKAITSALEHAAEVLEDDAATQRTVDRAVERLEYVFRWAQHVQPQNIVDYAARGVPVGEIWYDTEGNPIQAHGGGFLQQMAEDGKPIYYWVGENKIHNSAVFHAVSLYSSRDLVNWTYEGNIIDPFTQTVEGAEYTLVDNKWERPKLLYNDKTNKYVLWGHWETAGSYASSQVVVAISDHVAGPYTVLGHWRPGGTLRNWRSEGGIYLDSEYFKTSGIRTQVPSSTVDDVSQLGYTSRDFTVFVDADGTAYLVSAEGHSMRIHRLNDEYTDVDLTTYSFSDPAMKAPDFESYNFYEGDGREAPAVVSTDTGYFMVTSGQSGWLPNQGVISYTTNLADPHGWTPVSRDGLILPEYTFGNNSTYYSQPTNIMTLVALNGDRTYVYMGDRWNPGQLSDSRYVWLPITIDETAHTASITYTTGWTLDAASGSVEVPDVYLVSRGKPATITNNDAVSGIEKANDGIVYNLRVHGDSTHYFGGLVAPYEYTVDLGAVYDLSRIDVAYRLYNGSEMYHRYEILASRDHVNWTKLVDGNHNTWAGFTSDPLSGRWRYVKLKVNEVRRVNNHALSNGWGSGLVEVEVYAHSPDPFVLTAPTADLASGTYTFSQTVQLSHAALDAEIYYTLDGSDPTVASTRYTGPVALPAGAVTLKAVAVVDGEASDMLEVQYVILVDRPALVALIATAEGLEEDHYTPASWAVLQQALQAAIAARDNPAATESDVAEAADELRAAIDDLVRRPILGASLALSGADRIVAGQEFEVTVELTTASQSVYGYDLILGFDPSQLSFLSATSLKPGFTVLGQSVKQDRVRLIALDLQPDDPPQPPVGLLKLHFKALERSETVIGSVYIAQGVLADGFGGEIILCSWLIKQQADDGQDRRATGALSRVDIARRLLISSYTWKLGRGSR